MYAPLPLAHLSDDLSRVLLLDSGASADRSLETTLLKLFASGRHAFRTDVALASKVHDKVLLLDNPSRKPVTAAAAMRAASTRAWYGPMSAPLQLNRCISRHVWCTRAFSTDCTTPMAMLPVLQLSLVL